MPRLTSSNPKYQKHRASGQAVVTLDGRDFYLGPFGSKASKVEYDRLIGQWLANGRRLGQGSETDVTIAELPDAYLRFAQVYYPVPACGYAAEWDTTKQGHALSGAVVQRNPRGRLRAVDAEDLPRSDGQGRPLPYTRQSAGRADQADVQVGSRAGVG
ncbi:MAG: hypothetical protein NTU53_18305 [Planctomycetota bacterium]|nr:hypothetical protein [Planctomycetota bacterium]